MVNAAATIDTGSTGSSPYPRVASASVALSAATDVPVTAPQVNEAVNLSAKLRFNSFEFSYRQDFGKIVLLRQEPETGEVVQQFPSEYYLQKYAERERSVRTSQSSRNEPADGSNVPDVSARQNGANGASGTVDAGGDLVAASTPSPAPNTPSAAPITPSAAPSAPSAPNLPSGGVSAPRVDITV
jgi:hypothetical protein